MATSPTPIPVADWLRQTAACDPQTPLETLWERLLQGFDLFEPLCTEHPPPLATDLLTRLLALTLEALLPTCRHSPESCRARLATILADCDQQYYAIDEDAPATVGETRLQRLQLRLWFLQMISACLDGDTPVPYEDLLLYLEKLRLQLATADPDNRVLRHRVDRVSLHTLTDQANALVTLTGTLLAGQDPASTGDAPEPQAAFAAALVSSQQRCRRLYTQLLDSIGRCETYHPPAASGETQPTATLADARQALQALNRTQDAIIEHAIGIADRLSGPQHGDRWVQGQSEAMADFAADTLSDISDRSGQVQVSVLEASYRRLHRFRTALLDPRRKALPAEFKKVRQAERRLQNEWVEAGVSEKLAERFGPGFERRQDAMVIILVFAAIVLLLIDLGSELSAAQLEVLIWADTAICAGLMTDFLLRLHAAPDRGNFFRRHWFTDLLPSIPFAGLGFWFSSIATEAQGVTALRILRIVAVALRKARPLIQLGRMFLFTARGMDRLVRRYRHLLDWDILFFEPRPMNPLESLRVRGDRLGRRVRARRNRVASELDQAQAEAAINRDLALADRLRAALTRVELPPEPPPPPAAARQIAVETVIDRLTHTDPYEITEVLGVDFPRRLAKLQWVASMPPLRWLPGFNDVLAARRDTGNDLDFAETLARRLGSRLQGINDKVLFFSDLHGIITAPQFVDRVGATLVNSMRRPRNRLLMLGAGFIVVTLLVQVLPFGWLESAAIWLRKTLGLPILVLGIIAFIAVWFGKRLQTLAQTNTDFYTRVAEAKSINLLGDVKRAHAAEDQALLARRVLRPEANLHGIEVPADYQSYSGSGSGSGSGADPIGPEGVTANFRRLILTVFGQDPHGTAGSLAERVYLLYRDYLRGAHFDRNNTHTTDHLLGSPSLLNLRHQVLRMPRDQIEVLEELDLRRSSGIGGPSLWLRFVTHAMTQRVGQLVEEYNRHAIPLAERHAGFHDEPALQRFRRWLEHKRGQQPDEDERAGWVDQSEARYATTSFNALDFLSNDPARDDAIEQRYGSEVLDLIKADQQRLVREVFGIPALHRRPPSKRSFNPHHLYQVYLSRGRVFLLPLSLLRLLFKAVLFALRWFLKTLRQLRHPEPTPVTDQTGSFSDLRIALRKVHRMRKPVFLATTRLRCRVDVEYLGLLLPGEKRGTLEGSTVFEDLDMIGSSAEKQAEYRHMADRQRRQLGELTRFLAAADLLDEGLRRRLQTLFPNHPDHRRREVIRALSAAYVANYQDLRDLVSGPRRLAERVEAAIEQRGHHQTPGGLKRGLMRLLKRRQQRRHEQEFSDWWQTRGVRLIPEQGPATADPTQARAWVHRWWRADHQGIAQLVTLLGQLEHSAHDPEASARQAALAVIDGVTRGVANWTEQLVTLRTVQALTILDIQSTTHVIRGLGRYEDDRGEEPPQVRVTML